MDVILDRDGLCFGIDLASWHTALELARDNGWHFIGTLPPEGGSATWDPTRRVGEPAAAGQGAGDLRVVSEGRLWIDWSRDCTADDWDGNYLIPAGQNVSGEDARALADALEQALPTVPNEDVRGRKPGGILVPADMRHWFRPAPVGTQPDQPQALDAIEWFSGAGKQQVRDLIAFCREGGFRVR
jgi:hypothetical protein